MQQTTSTNQHHFVSGEFVLLTLLLVFKSFVFFLLKTCHNNSVSVFLFFSIVFILSFIYIFFQLFCVLHLTDINQFTPARSTSNSVLDFYLFLLFHFILCIFYLSIFNYWARPLSASVGIYHKISNTYYKIIITINLFMCSC